jgi:thiol-disulfide isomerase/thioredoxin
MKDLIYYLLIVVALIVYLNLPYSSPSTFNAMGSSSSTNTVYIFYAPWCGHCKRSMNEFTKASTNPNIILINTDDPSSKMLMREFDINGFPTIVRSDGTQYDGDRIADKIIEFANYN